MTTTSSVTSTVTLPVTSTTGTDSTTSSVSSSASSSSVSSISSVASTSTTVVNPNKEAFDKLAVSNVQNLWNKHCVDVNPFYGFFIGMIVYLWNKSEAVELDKAHGETIKNFNDKLVALTQLTALRNNTISEASAIDAKQKGLTQAQQEIILAYNKAIEEYYAVFKERVAQINGKAIDFNNAAEFAPFAAAATKFAFTKFLPVDSTLRTSYENKNCSTTDAFFGKLYADVISGFANKNPADITIDSYKAMVAHVGNLFPNNQDMDIEASIRQALLSKKGNAAEFIKLQTALRVIGAGSEAAKIEQQMRDALTAEQTAVNVRLGELCGPTGFDGLVNAAQTEFDAARLAFINAFNAHYGVAATAEQMALFVRNNAAAPQNVLDALNNFEAAFQKLDALKKEQAELAVWDHTGAIVGGKSHEITGKLATVAADARKEATKIAGFYGELAQTVTDRNKQQRFNAMHRIIG